MSQPSENNSIPSTAPEKPRPLSLSERVRSLRLPERTTAAPQGRSWLPWLLVVLLTISTLFFAFRPAGTKSAETEIRQPSSANQTQADGQGKLALENKGYIIPVQQIQVSPKVSGMVVKLWIKEGDRVKKNDLLAELEDVEYQSDYLATRGRFDEQAKYRTKEIEQLEAELKDSEFQRFRNMLNWNRIKDLEKKGGASKQELEDAESNYKTMEQRVRRAKLLYNLMGGLDHDDAAGVVALAGSAIGRGPLLAMFFHVAVKPEGPRDAKIYSAQADRRKAEWRLESCKVRAPIDGIILKKNTEYGAIVNPSAFSSGIASSVCEMADLCNMEVDVAVAERDIHKVFKGQNCKVRTEAFPDRNYTGVVSRLMPMADRSKGAVPVRILVSIPREEEGRYLRPDMGAIVTFYNK